MPDYELPFGSSGWDYNRMPDLTGKTAIVTGGNSGIGFESAKKFVSKNAHVTIFCRNEEKAKAAVADIAKEAGPEGKVDYILMDLSDLASVRAAAEHYMARHEKLDILLNNAGLMMIPTRTLTKDGFETQFGVNHLGHFVFAQMLFPLVEKAAGRIIAVSSIAHNWGLKRIKFDDLNFDEDYSSTNSYGQSKLANMLFIQELQRRLKAANSKVNAYVVHPGYADTNLQRTGPGGIEKWMMVVFGRFFSHPPVHGAKSLVLASTDPEAKPATFYGPVKRGGLGGPVGISPVAPQGKDMQAAEKLWDISEELTNVKWSV
ncbi:oxidoreductase [Maritalea sp.]|uniref:oxidoreductase n=1 Tax=Maritalea sp. TaxID=2003361 RepID=UPI003EF13D93